MYACSLIIHLLLNKVFNAQKNHIEDMSETSDYEENDFEDDFDDELDEFEDED